MPLRETGVLKAMTKHRLQFDFTDDALNELDKLRELTGLPNRAELIRHALRFFQWMLNETREKKASVLLEKDGKLREIVLPFWILGDSRPKS